jgi:hypothetical protein
MGLEELGRTVSAHTDRRRLLRQACAASVAAVGGMMARTRPAGAEPIVDTFSYHGCNLCHAPPTQDGPGCPSLRCAWCWWGNCHGPEGNRHQNLCCEGYSHNSGGRCCDPTECRGVVCSFLGEYSRKCQGYDGEPICD